MTNTHNRGPVYGAARKAFIDMIQARQKQTAWDILGQAAMLNANDGVGAQMRKLEAIERVTTLVAAEHDLGKLLRPGLDEDDWAETMARWLLYLAGGTVDVDKALTAILDAVTPAIEADFAARLDKEFERMIEVGLLVDPIIHTDELPADRQKRKTMHDALWGQAAVIAYQMAEPTPGRRRPVSETPDERLQREEALTERLHNAVFVSPAAAERALTDGATQLRIELLRGVLLGADHAMRTEHIDEATRDRVCHHIIFGDPPRDPTATPDEQIETARAEEEMYLQRQKALAGSTPFQVPPELLASIPTPWQQARDALDELKMAVAKLHASEEPGDHEAAWDLCREAAEWAMGIYGHPGEHHDAYLIVLKAPLEDDEAEHMLRLLLRINGVIAVEPIEEGWNARSPEVTMRIATLRVQDSVNNALYEALDGHWYAPRQLKTKEEASEPS